MISDKKGVPSLDEKRWSMWFENLFSFCKKDEDIEKIIDDLNRLIRVAYQDILDLRKEDA